MKRYNLLAIAKVCGLLFGVIGVILYRELPIGWNLFCWIPITFGYGLWFGDLLESLR